MLESGYACGWVFANGDLSLNNPNTYLALGRGIFLEGLIFAMFKLVRVFALKGGRGLVLSVLPFLIGVVGMIVSAGCNLGWVNRSGEMTSVTAMVGQFMPALLVSVFKIGLGLLFPLAVGAFALFDVTHLVEDILKSSHLDNRAVKVQSVGNASYALPGSSKESRDQGAQGIQGNRILFSRLHLA